MKTVSAKAHEVERAWFVVDAEDETLGRLATRVAVVLRGKHKPIYTPHVDTGDFVVIINAEKIRVSGKKEDDKVYYRYSGFPGGMKERNVGRVRKEHPERILKMAVKGMMPKGPLGRQMLRKLKVYAGGTHPHAAQQPKPLS